MRDFHVIKADRRWRNAEQTQKEAAAQSRGGGDDAVYGVSGDARGRSDSKGTELQRAATRSLKIVTSACHPSPGGSVRVVSKRILAWRIGLLLVLGIAALPGSILATPMFLLANNYSEKKAKSAKEGSTVKIAGRDVMATWKLLIALGVVPLMHASYTTLAYVCFGQTACVAFFFFAPFVCASSILATERGNKLLASLKPLWIMMSHEKESLRHLVQTRRALAKQARSVVSLF